jgi:Na+/phosphate symporter
VNHLYDVQMTWWTHAIGAWKMGLKLFLLSLTALVHGLLPFTFSSTTSDGIKKIADDLDQGNNT